MPGPAPPPAAPLLSSHLRDQDGPQEGGLGQPGLCAVVPKRLHAVSALTVPLSVLLQGCACPSSPQQPGLEILRKGCQDGLVHLGAKSDVSMRGMS